MVLGCQGESNQTTERLSNVAFDRSWACRRLGPPGLGDVRKEGSFEASALCVESGKQTGGSHEQTQKFCSLLSEDPCSLCNGRAARLSGRSLTATTIYFSPMADSQRRCTSHTRKHQRLRPKISFIQNATGVGGCQTDAKRSPPCTLIPTFLKHFINRLLDVRRCRSDDFGSEPEAILVKVQTCQQPDRSVTGLLQQRAFSVSLNFPSISGAINFPSRIKTHES